MSDDAFSAAQVAQLEAIMSKVVRDELADSGLRLGDPTHADENRKDFQFIRALRMGVNGVASKIGWTIIAAVLGGAIWIFTQGINLWKGH